MKRIALRLFACLIPMIGMAQEEFSFQLCFEDSEGNKDTLVLGYDVNATQGIDLLFGEADFSTEPWDSVFEVRASNNVVPGPTTGNPPSIFTKKQIVQKVCSEQPFGFMDFNVLINMKALHYPITIRWDGSVFSDECNIATSIHTYQYIFSDWEWGCCPTFMSSVIELDSNITSISSFQPIQSDSLVFQENEPLAISYLLNQEVEISCVRLSFSQLREIPPLDIVPKDFTEVIIYPNPAKERVVIEGLSGNENTDVKIFDSKGRMILQRQINLSNRIELNTESLEQGIYLIYLEIGKYNIAKKIQIL